MAIDRDILNAASSVINFSKAQIKSSGRKSLSALTKDSILQYPLILSADIPRDMMIDITRGMERQIATSLIMYLSTNNLVDTKEFSQPSEYIHQFNNTDALPKNLETLSDIGSILSGRAFANNPPSPSPFLGISVESAIAKSSDGKTPYTEDTILECWDATQDLINTGSINDLYRGYEATKRSLNRALESAKAAELSKKLDSYVGQPGSYQGNNFSTSKSGSINYANPQTHTATDDKGRSYQVINKDVYGKSQNNPPKITTDIDKKMWMLEPTMVETDLIIHSTLGNDNINTPMRISFGVKCMDRVIPSNIMVDNICNGIKSRGMFTFVQWARGELKIIRDLLLGINTAKTDARLSKTSGEVFASLRRMSRKNKINAFLSNKKSGVPPTSTIIITTTEAEQIKQVTGVDLREDRVAAKFIYDTFLLAFGILDIETETLAIMYDAYTNFSVVSIRALKQTSKSDTSIKDFKEMARMFGRI